MVVCPKQAAEFPSQSNERIMKVLAFFVSVYSTINRADKPFKDLFGSTFEFVDPRKGLRVLTEKVRSVERVRVNN
jgi:hypothetical protein